MITIYVMESSPKAEKKTHPVENNPLVRFFYPHEDEDGSLGETLREVKMIAADGKYVLGLDVYDKNRFKRFLRNKMRHFVFMEFNPAAAKINKKVSA